MTDGAERSTTPEPLTADEIERIRTFALWEARTPADLTDLIGEVVVLCDAYVAAEARTAALVAEVEQVKREAFEGVTSLRIGVRDMLDATDDLIQFVIYELDCEGTEALERLRTARQALQQLLGEGLHLAASQPEDE